MSNMTKRTKIIIGVTLTVSLVANFFLLGWLVGTSPLMPGSLAGRLGAAVGLLRPPPGSGMSPEQRFVDFLTRDLSETGRRKVLAALDSRASDIRDLERQAITIRADIVSLLLQPEPEQPRVAKRIEDFEQLMRRRIAIVSAAILPVVLDLGLEDRRMFVERWAMGPGAPPPPPPPR
jgi:hypothetical protein